MIGNCDKNKWCCFCSNWYDPTNSAIVPKSGRGMFDVNINAKCKCMRNNCITKALFTCNKFNKKF